MREIINFEREVDPFDYLDIGYKGLRKLKKDIQNKNFLAPNIPLIIDGLEDGYIPEEYVQKFIKEGIKKHPRINKEIWKNWFLETGKIHWHKNMLHISFEMPDGKLVNCKIYSMASTTSTDNSTKMYGAFCASYPKIDLEIEKRESLCIPLSALYVMQRIFCDYDNILCSVYIIIELFSKITEKTIKRYYINKSVNDTKEIKKYFKRTPY